MWHSIHTLAIYSFLVFNSSQKVASNAGEVHKEGWLQSLYNKKTKMKKIIYSTTWGICSFLGQKCFVLFFHLCTTTNYCFSSWAELVGCEMKCQTIETLVFAKTELAALTQAKLHFSLLWHLICCHSKYKNACTPMGTIIFTTFSYRSRYKKLPSEK